MCLERTSATTIGGDAGDADVLILSYRDTNNAIRFYCGVSGEFFAFIKCWNILTVLKNLALTTRSHCYG